MRYLALDVGDRRIGVAVGEETFGMARPLRTIRRHDLDSDLAQVRDIVAKEDVAGLVIGLPLTLRGEDGPQALRVRRFADAAAALGLPIDLVDERFTTSEAERTGAVDLDAGAAALILQDFFSQRRRRS